MCRGTGRAPSSTQVLANRLPSPASPPVIETPVGSAPDSPSTSGVPVDVQAIGQHEHRAQVVAAQLRGQALARGARVGRRRRLRSARAAAACD